MAVLFVPVDPETILSEIIADFETITGRTLEPSQPEYLFCSALAYRIVLERQRINAAGNSQLLEFSSAPVIDYLVQLVGVNRLPAQHAVCTLQFTLVAGHNTVTIPKGTRVISTDGQATFATTQDATVNADILVVNVPAECETAGDIGNDYAIGTITQIQDVQAYLSACQNIDITAGGSDEETDDQLRSRAFGAPSQFSVAGPRAAYKFFALSASPLILDVAVVSYAEDQNTPYGQINIYPLLANGEVANQALLDAIRDTLNDEKIRPLTDYIIVANPTRVEYSLNINITKLKGANTSLITSALSAKLLQYGKDKIKKLGLDIVNSEVEALCRIDGVYDVDVTIVPPSGMTLTGDNLVLKSNEFPFMTNFNVNVTATANG